MALWSFFLADDMVRQKRKEKKGPSRATVPQLKEKILLFTNYGPTWGMNIHIYNYLKHNMFNKDKDTITYTYNMSFIC